MTEADSVVSRSAVSEVTSSPETSECEVNRLRADIVDLRKRLTKPAGADTGILEGGGPT